MIPSFIELFFQEGFELIASKAKMGFNDLSCQNLSLILNDEELSVWFSLLGNTLCSIVFEHIGRECVNILMILIRVEVGGDIAIVSISPLTTIVVVSDEAVHGDRETSEVRGGFGNSKGLGERMRVESSPLGEFKLFIVVLRA